ncbi:hypothetical protein AGLY_011520, partial [Aphis glycines]
MKNDEDVLTYTGRVEQLYYNLCNATLANKTPEEARILRQTLKDQALAIYINGLQMDLQTILRARNPETLELAMQMARQLEIEFSFNKELRNNENKTSQGGNKNNNGNRWSNNYQGNNPSGKNFGYKQNYNRGQNRQNPNNYNNVNRSNNFNSFGRNNNNSNNYPRNNNNGQYNNNRRQQNNPGCYICGRTNHVARDSRGNIAQIARRNTNNNAQPQNNNARQNTNNNFNNNSAPITCSYCNKIGHDSVSCYSKQRDERNNANRSGNGQVSNGNGVRSINQITAVTEDLSLNDVSPSYHIFTALMTQYSYETQTLSAIITAARTSVLHPSLVTPRELAAQLVDVKLNLPLNLNLPMGTLPSEIHEFTKITKIAVFYSGSQIVFLIKIPLITETQLTLFKIIPIPHSVGLDRTDNKTHSIVLKPEYQYVGITKNRRQFTTFTEIELLHCTETETFTICPEFQPVQHESKDQPCEISLFKNPDQLPQNCESGVIIISKNIFHKLKYANTWIYTTRKDTLTITCQGVPEPYIEKIKNQGIIKLNQECRAYAEHVVLNPTREIKTKYFTNFIPKIGVGNISYKINSSIKDIKIEKYKHKFDSGKLDNVHEMAHSLNEVENMIDEEILRQSGVEVQSNTNSLMMYAIMALLVFSLFLLAFIYISYKCKLTTMRAIGHQTRTMNDDTANRESKIVYVKSPVKENRAKEKLLETHKFVIMDFEFSMVNKTSMVVISGAISNSLDRFKIRKLEGRPLLLPLNEEARPMGETELQVAVREIKRVFRVKTELRDACLDQLKQSLNSTKNNLTKGYIDSYIRRGNKENVIVVWNGHSDKNILTRLDLDHYPMLNITCYDKYFNKNFYIQFEKLNNREIIFEVDIGTYNKSGRLLNLVETHDVICKKKHHTTYAHDPRMDVKYTKCIFDYVIRKQRYENLQLASAISFNIETQFHINPTQGEWHNYTACFDFHIITANENIIVPYEDETILEMIEAAKRFLSDMAGDREFGEPYCYELNYYLEIIQNPQDILNYRAASLDWVKQKYFSEFNLLNHLDLEYFSNKKHLEIFRSFIFLQSHPVHSTSFNCLNVARYSTYLSEIKILYKLKLQIYNMDNLIPCPVACCNEINTCVVLLFSSLLFLSCVPVSELIPNGYLNEIDECRESVQVLIALVHLPLLVFGLPYISWCVYCLRECLGETRCPCSYCCKFGPGLECAIS